MGRKAKKGDFLDLDDPEAPEQQEAESEPANAAKPKGKKGKKGKNAAFADGNVTLSLQQCQPACSRPVGSMK